MIQSAIIDLRRNGFQTKKYKIVNRRLARSDLNFYW